MSLSTLVPPSSATIQTSSSSTFVRHSSAAVISSSSNPPTTGGSGLMTVSSAKVNQGSGGGGVQTVSSIPQSQASAAAAATKPESRRGRFEVYPEQALSLSDWTTLPKAPAGFVETTRLQFMKNSSNSRERLNRNDRNNNYDRERSHDRHDRENDRIISSSLSLSRPRVASSASISSVPTNRNKLVTSAHNNIITPQVVPGSLMHTMAPEAAQQYIKQYILALTALNQMRNSVAGLAQGLGLKAGTISGSNLDDDSATLGVLEMAPNQIQTHIASSSTHTIHQSHQHQNQHFDRTQSSSAVLSQSAPIAAPPPQAPTTSSLAQSTSSSSTSTSANITDSERLKAEVERLDRTRRSLLLDKKKLEEDVDEKNKMITILKQKLAKAQLLAK
jgi:hypothetical protein